MRRKKETKYWKRCFITSNEIKLSTKQQEPNERRGIEKTDETVDIDHRLQQFHHEIHRAAPNDFVSLKIFGIVIMSSFHCAFQFKRTNFYLRLCVARRCDGQRTEKKLDEQRWTTPRGRAFMCLRALIENEIARKMIEMEISKDVRREWWKNASHFYNKIIYMCNNNNNRWYETNSSQPVTLPSFCLHLCLAHSLFLSSYYISILWESKLDFVVVYIYFSSIHVVAH